MIESGHDVSDTQLSYSSLAAVEQSWVPLSLIKRSGGTNLENMSLLLANVVGDEFRSMIEEMSSRLETSCPVSNVASVWKEVNDV